MAPSKVEPEATFPRTVSYSKGASFPNNHVRTTRYTWHGFLFMCTFNQFRRLANCYFLLIAVLCCIDKISPYSPVTAVGPLMFVLGTSVRHALPRAAPAHPPRARSLTRSHAPRDTRTRPKPPQA